MSLLADIPSLALDDRTASTVSGASQGRGSPACVQTRMRDPAGTMQVKAFMSVAHIYIAYTTLAQNCTAAYAIIASLRSAIRNCPANSCVISS